MDPQLAEALLYLLCKSIAELAMRPLTAARPWDDSAWAGTAHMHKHFMRLSLCTVSWRALCA